MNFLTSLRTLLLALILSIGISYAYAAWTAPTANPPGGNIDAPVNVGGGSQTKAGPLWSDLFIGSSAGGYFGGNLQVAGNIQVPTLCLSGDCKSAWPSGSGSVDWSSITNRPSGLDDGDDVGATPGTNVYSCPSGGGSCQGGIGSCQGQLSLSSTCTRTASGGGATCINQTFSCSLVGRLVTS